MVDARTVMLITWSHSTPEGSRDSATRFFETLRDALALPKPRMPFPFEGAYEVALINAGTGRFVTAGEVWMVALLVPMADNGNLVFALRPWLIGSGVSWGASESDCEDGAGTETLQEMIDRRGWGTLINSFSGTAVTPPPVVEEPEGRLRRPS